MAKPPRVLVVDDEPDITELIETALRRNGFRCETAGDADQARTRITATRPDLVLLDWRLPGESGLDFARSLKQDSETYSIPIIMLTAHDQESRRIEGLDAGADDYVSKPFSMRELMARVRAVLRRATPSERGMPLEIGDVRIEPDTQRVIIAETPLKLSATEFRLLHFLATNPGRVLSRAQILDAVWDTGSYVGDRTVDVHIRRLRKQLSTSGNEALVQTVRGVGYRFSSPTAAQS